MDQLSREANDMTATVEEVADRQREQVGDIADAADKLAE